MILGLDFGTHTGAAYGEPGAAPDRIVAETWPLPAGDGADVGAFMHELRRRLDDRLGRGITTVVFEAPYVAQHRDHRGHVAYSPNQLRRAFGAAAVCEEVCFARGVRVVEAVTVTLKKEFAGHGRADKADMVPAARRRGFDIANHHEADAVACWLHAVLHLYPQHAALYDPIFGVSRP